MDDLDVDGAFAILSLPARRFVDRLEQKLEAVLDALLQQYGTAAVVRWYLWEGRLEGAYGLTVGGPIRITDTCDGVEEV